MNFFYLSAALLLFDSHIKSQGTLSIRFAPVIAGKQLELGRQLYHSATGDSFQVDALRFYITGIQLQGKDGTVFIEKDSYHLIDAEDSITQTVILKNIPDGRYDAVRFNIGTDSSTNISGAMGGDLDPTKGMYWAWNSGFINFKIEGRSNVCKTLHHSFEFHIGGYMPPYQTVRRVVLPFKKVKIAPQKDAGVQIDVDLAPFFDQIQLAKTNQVMIPSMQAALLADNFKNIFSIH